MRSNRFSSIYIFLTLQPKVFKYPITDSSIISAKTRITKKESKRWITYLVYIYWQLQNVQQYSTWQNITKLETLPTLTLLLPWYTTTHPLFWIIWSPFLWRCVCVVFLWVVSNGPAHQWFIAWPKVCFKWFGEANPTSLKLTKGWIMISRCDTNRNNDFKKRTGGCYFQQLPFFGKAKEWHSGLL